MSSKRLVFALLLLPILSSAVPTALSTASLTNPPTTPPSSPPTAPSATPSIIPPSTPSTAPSTSQPTTPPSPSPTTTHPKKITLPDEFFGNWTLSEAINEPEYREATKSWWNQKLWFLQRVLSDIYFERADKPDEFHVRCNNAGTFSSEYKFAKLGEFVWSDEFGHLAVFTYENGVLYKEKFDRYRNKLSLYPRYEMQIDGDGKLVTRTHYYDLERKPAIFTIIYVRANKH